ncbi:Beta-2-glycoprotein 1 [Merluccius polli]|uniref:Beta-2-glycoprotein 1 n=1 Tax=Merluccius polli TaxID=89951 RepID=A0AA47NXQ8_MERPO|nr:Beta-2-glycoprotein 1 [Merluccius polli]
MTPPVQDASDPSWGPSLWPRYSSTFLLQGRRSTSLVYQATPPDMACTLQGSSSALFREHGAPFNLHASNPPINGDMYLEDNVYQSTINFTCNKGYNLHGASSVVCQENATWSASSPKCKAVTCGPAPVPDNARIEYHVHRVSGGNVEFGTMGIYKCLPPMALIGNPRAECTSSGKWTEAPVCQFVTCPLPEPIEHGHMSSKSLNNYKDTVRYGCRLPFTIDGNPYVQCLETGQWSSKPSCRAPCTVNIARGRILYNGRKFWIEDLIPNQVYHNDQVYFYCLNAASSCGYTVPSRCTNGKLRIPECFEGKVFLMGDNG